MVLANSSYKSEFTSKKKTTENCIIYKTIAHPGSPEVKKHQFLCLISKSLPSPPLTAMTSAKKNF